MKELKGMISAFMHDRQGVSVLLYVIGMIGLMYLGFYLIHILGR